MRERISSTMNDGLRCLSGGEPHSPPDVVSPQRSESPEEQVKRGPGRKRLSTNNSSVDLKRIANKVCRVCGDKAFSYNFNVITCESCKAFFRRNAFKENEIRCPFNEQCEITTLSRRFCQRCRLVKCFAVGMKKEWIMSDEARLEKKARVEENRERRMREAVVGKMETHEKTPPNTSKHNSVKNAIRKRLSSESRMAEEIKDEIPFIQNYSSPDSGDKLSVPSIPSIASIGTPQSAHSIDSSFLVGTSMSTNLLPSASSSHYSQSSSHYDAHSALPPPIVAPLLAEPLTQVVNQCLPMPPIPDFNLPQTLQPIQSMPSMQPMQPIQSIQPMQQLPPMQQIPQAVLAPIQPQLSSMQPMQTIQPAQVLDALSLAEVSSVQNVLAQPAIPTNNLLSTQQDLTAQSNSLAATAATALAQVQLVAQAQVQLQQQAQQMAAVVAQLPQMTQQPLMPQSLTSQPSLPQLPPQINFPTAPPIPGPPSLQSLPQTVALPASLPKPQQHLPPTSDSNTITIPKEIFFKLIKDAHGCGSGSLNEKCTCECRCGFYSKEASIAEQVTKEIEDKKCDEEFKPFEVKNEGVVNQVCQEVGNEMQRNGLLPSENSNVSWFAQGLPPNLAGSGGNLQRSIDDVMDMNVMTPMFSVFDTDHDVRSTHAHYALDPDCTLMTHYDEEKLNDLLSANNITWGQQLEGKEKKRHEEQQPNKEAMVNMAEGAIRRLAKMLKKLDVFQKLPQKDQMEIIRKNSMQYLVLRGAMAYDPSENAWRGPTQKSGYSIKMDAMKSTPDNLLEHSIRFYSTFKEEHRTNESVMLLLGQLVLFRSDGLTLEKPEAVNDLFHLYKTCLKRLLYQLNNGDCVRTVNDFHSLLDKLNQIKDLQRRALGMVRGVDANSLEPLLKEMFEVIQSPIQPQSSSSQPLPSPKSMPSTPSTPLVSPNNYGMR